MEIMYPTVIIAFTVIALIIFFIRFDKKIKYSYGKKIANTKYVKETEYFKVKLKKYKIITNIIKSLYFICIIATSILIARLVTVQNLSQDKYNRDIIIGLDISTSQCEVNLELIKKFKSIVPNIEGDRIGIVLFNTAPIVYCPLTEDYDYINECLDKIEKQLDVVVKNNGNIPYTDTPELTKTEILTFWHGGVTVDSETRGSSLVGDGLAGTLLSFPNLKEDTQRTRIIIFATDNDVSGTETVSLEEACKLCKEYNVNIYAYCPTVEMNPLTSKEKINSYKEAVEKEAGGKFYTGNLEQMSSNIVEEIKNTKTSLLQTSKKTYVTDEPQAIFIIIIIIFVILIIMEKRVRL